MSTIVCSDALTYVKSLESESVDCFVFSPPYFGVRNYGVEGQWGNEPSIPEFINNLVMLCTEIKRVLKKTGTLWINIGDSMGRGAKALSPNDASRKDGNITTPAMRHGAYGKSQSIQPEKSCLLIPERLIIALADSGWLVRSKIVWAKTNGLPESVKDRPTRSTEMIFFLTKSKKYFYDQDAIREPHAESSEPRMLRGVAEDHKNVDGAPGQTPHSLAKPRKHAGTNHGTDGKGLQGHSGNYRADGTSMLNPLGRNKRDVWHMSTASSEDEHYAVFPLELPLTCIKAGCPPGGVVCDPFMGSGTTAVAAVQLGRKVIGCDLNPKNVAMANDKIRLPFEKRQTEKKSLPLNDLPLFKDLT